MCVCADRRLYQLGVALVFLSISTLWLFIRTVYFNRILVPHSLFPFLLYLQILCISLVQNPTLTFSKSSFLSSPSPLSTFSSQLLLRVQSLSPALYFFSSLCLFFHLFMHSLPILAARQGSFRRSLTVKLVPVPLQSILTCDKDRRGKVLEKWR